MFELIQKLRNNKKETRKKLQMKMRPLRVKVRKPIVEEEEIGNLPDPMDETFGLKEPEPNGDLVLEPTPAVPGRPVSHNLLQCRNYILYPSFLAGYN